MRAVPAGLATVGIGLLENLSANRAALTYLALASPALFLVLRFRSLARAAARARAGLPGRRGVVVDRRSRRLELSPLTTVAGPLVIAVCTEFSVLILGALPRGTTETG